MMPLVDKAVEEMTKGDMTRAVKSLRRTPGLKPTIDKLKTMPENLPVKLNPRDLIKLHRKVRKEYRAPDFYKGQPFKNTNTDWQTMPDLATIDRIVRGQI